MDASLGRFFYPPRCSRKLAWEFALKGCVLSRVLRVRLLYILLTLLGLQSRFGGNWEKDRWSFSGLSPKRDWGSRGVNPLETFQTAKSVAIYTG